MEASEVLAKLLDALGVNAKKMADVLGYNRPEKLYKILRGESKSISQSIISDIVKAFPQVNEMFLINLEGEVLKDKSRNFNDVQIGAYTEKLKGTQNVAVESMGEKRTKYGASSEMRIKELEEEVESLKRQLEMKDEIIESKNEIIQLLKNK